MEVEVAERLGQSVQRVEEAQLIAAHGLWRSTGGFAKCDAMRASRHAVESSSRWRSPLRCVTYDLSQWRLNQGPSGRATVVR